MSLHYAVAAEKLERIVAAQAVDAHIAMDLDYAARCLRVAAGAGDDPPIQRRDAMTMRVMIKNADETGRLAVVLVEERGALEHDWKYLDRVYLKQSEERAFFIHAASRLTVTEDPSATVARP